MSEDALFALPAGVAAPAAPSEQVSPDRRRTIRQAAALARGRHPLELALGRPLRLHDQAAPHTDRAAAGLRCGTCRFRELTTWHNRAWPKCLADDGRRTTHGPGTDIRAWWPACRDYEPKEGTT